MHRPITLWRPSRTEGSQGSSPPPNIPPPYQAHTRFLDESANDTLKYIPSLKFFCIRKLLEYPDEVYRLGTTRIHYQPPESLQEFDLLRALMPSFRHQGQEDSITAEDYFQFDLTTVDPRLWAILIQLLDNVPDSLRIYRLSLCDAHLPLLQQIPSTPTFSLVTILELGGRSEVTDDTITELGRLNGLGALDLSRTSISSWGIIRLCKMLKLSEPESNEEGPRLKGPWGLRVLYLKDCMNIKEDVLGGLNKFPLLSVVGEQPDTPFDRLSY